MGDSQRGDSTRCRNKWNLNLGCTTKERARVYPPKVQRAYVPTAREASAFVVHSTGLLRSR